MEHTETQQRIVLSLNAINLMSYTLNTVNQQMGMSQMGPLAKGYQEQREKFLESIASDLSKICNNFGDFLNGIDCVDENLLAVTEPMFTIINGGTFEDLE